MVANTSDAGMGPPREPGRDAWARGARLLWWILFVSLLLAILGLLAFLWPVSYTHLTLPTIQL